MNTKSLLPLVITAFAILAGGIGAFAYLNNPVAITPAPILPTSLTEPAVSSVANVHMEGGRQIVEIHAKGMYSPLLSQAKAGVPTIIRIVTDDTFDCTSIVAIPSLRYQLRLPISGTTDIPLAAQLPGATITGLCGMAMYTFDIEFSA